jgi:hypothetical protein
VSEHGQPIFIIGTERSGSNLLRLILDAHSRIVIPHPPHIMKYLAHIEPSYGDLTVDANMRELVFDIFALIEAHIFPWDEYPLDIDDIVAAAPARSTFGAVAAIYERVREHTGKARWGNKSTFMVHFTEPVRAIYPEARFILLVRDPRDVAVSARRSIFSPCHPLLSAELWRHQQQIGLVLLDSLPSHSITLLRYEDLTSDPQKSLAQICAFLDEDFEPDMLRFFEGAQARTGAKLSESWENTGRPILQNNSQKFHRELAPRHILAVEATCAGPMAELGYAPVTDTAQREGFHISAAARARVQLAEAGMRAGVEWRSLRHDSNHWRRWRRDATARWLSLRRGGQQ